jgi:hypothetical protein
MNHLEAVAKKQGKTLIITDERCLQHAGFENYNNIGKRVFTKA